MRIITETSTQLAKYALADDEVIISTAENLQIGDDPVKFFVTDLNSTTVTVTDNVTNVPEEWVGNKYTFDGTTWTLNPDWVEPE